MEDDNSILADIQQKIDSNQMILFMKGTPEMPQCGFSAKVCQILMACGYEFAYINVLDNPDVRRLLPQIANWPTFPQLYVNHELIGGSDIVMEMHQSGELLPLIEAAMGSKS